ncbi:MAG TPA: PilZ domain-containing protein [Vicinamibacteria bacterium]|nr:PilZ domain-containing protein [Vicinamibacteria bacterium]
MSKAVVDRVRIPFVQRATVRVGGVPSTAFLIDLAMEGVFVECAEKPSVGDSVAVSFRLPGNAIPVEARGAVAWVHDAGRPPRGFPAGFGVRFAEMAEAHRGRLRDYLAAYCRRGPKGRRFARPWPTAGALGGEP